MKRAGGCVLRSFVFHSAQTKGWYGFAQRGERGAQAWLRHHGAQTAHLPIAGERRYGCAEAGEQGRGCGCIARVHCDDEQTHRIVPAFWLPPSVSW